MLIPGCNNLLPTHILSFPLPLGYIPVLTPRQVSSLMVVVLWPVPSLMLIYYNKSGVCDNYKSGVFEGTSGWVRISLAWISLSTETDVYRGPGMDPSQILRVFDIEWWNQRVGKNVQVRVQLYANAGNPLQELREFTMTQVGVGRMYIFNITVEHHPIGVYGTALQFSFWQH